MRRNVPLFVIMSKTAADIEAGRATIIVLFRVRNLFPGSVTNATDAVIGMMSHHE